MRALLRSTSVVLSCLAASCSGDVPRNPVGASTVPPPSAQPQPQPQPSGWNVVISLTGGNGPAECPAGARVGQINSYPLGVERTPDGVMLILDPHNYPTDHWADYEGSLTDGVVAAQGRYYGGDLCGGMVVNGLTNYGVPAVFAGTLSADGTILTGKETRTTVVDGKTYSYEYDWRAELKQQ